ncbi:radical SAM protein [Bradyrhizobium sp. BR 10289]|uniref:radical SAM protein n=1 Tax=Bradyrhizobium sp. BR 10289 TaxID=2749993 RepID=UPI001C645E78|nr:radical SAM protein [Bradyrhizobium sp. BR 10289]MBW7969867.1 radical SAM protein [Bradyrhizobium sp. BR 10289]
MPHYDIEADWHLLDTCNYRCDYCFFGADVLGSKLKSYATAEAWSSAFDRTGKTWLLHLTGGEPSIYPNFVELCSALAKRHLLSINTNLTNASIVRFARDVNPARVSFINAGFHPEERDRRGETTRFIEHADLLRKHGFRIFCSVVATPLALTTFDEAVERLSRARLYPVPKLFRGNFAGKSYPLAYTERERTMFRSYAQRARDFYHGEGDVWGEPPSIDVFNDDRYLTGLPTYGGRLCSAGERFVQIHPNGDVFRCGGTGLQGNLLQGTTVFQSGASVCQTEHCYYFCEKYSQAETAPTGFQTKRSSVTNLFARRMSDWGFKRSP